MRHNVGFIPSRIHGILDYIVGIALIAAPWVLGFADNSANNTTYDALATWVPVAVGLVIIGLSLITQYEYSIAKIVAYSTHIVMDMVAGLFLAASPWLFGFAGYVYLPHVIVGLAIVVIAFFTVRGDSVNKTNRLVEGTVR